MKKLAILLILLAAFVANAAAPAAFTDAVGVFELLQGDTTTSSFDTLTADNDTCGNLLYSNFVPEQGYEYILGRAALSGTGADSVKIEVGMRCEDVNGVAICTVYVDSFTTQAGEYISIPFDNYPAHTYDIFLIAYAAIGTQVIINRTWMGRRQPLFIRKNWR